MLQVLGDMEFEQLYRANAPGVTAYVARRLPPDSVQDVVAETFAVAWRRRDQVPEEAFPWLLAVARRVLANHRRTARRRATVPLSEVAQPPAADGRDFPEVLAALRGLPERDREALMLAAWEGLSAEQAARVLGCSATAFRIRLHRARRKLSATLDDEPGVRQRAVQLRPEELL